MMVTISRATGFVQHSYLSYKNRKGYFLLSEFIQQIEETAQESVDNIHTAIPGKILSFDAIVCLAKVKPIGRFLTPEDEIMDYPVISDVPVMFPYSQKSKTGVFFPVKEGDYGMLVISESELDEWRTGAVSEATLRFDLTSAIFIPGLLQKGNKNLDDSCKDGSAVIVSKNTKIITSEKDVKIIVNNVQVATIKDDNIRFDGNIKVNGNINVNGNITYTGTISQGG